MCTWVKLLTCWQILSCKLHKDAFGGRAPPGPAGGAIALPRLSSSYKGKGQEGSGRKGSRIGRGKVRE